MDVLKSTFLLNYLCNEILDDFRKHAEKSIKEIYWDSTLRAMDSLKDGYIYIDKRLLSEQFNKIEITLPFEIYLPIIKKRLLRSFNYSNADLKFISISSSIIQASLDKYLFPIYYAIVTDMVRGNLNDLEFYNDQSKLQLASLMLYLFNGEVISKVNSLSTGSNLKH